MCGEFPGMWALITSLSLIVDLLTGKNPKFSLTTKDLDVTKSYGG